MRHWGNWERELRLNLFFPEHLGSGGSEEEPMQLGNSHLSAAERERRISAGECLYCSRK